MKGLFLSCYRQGWVWILLILLLTIALTPWISQTQIQVSNESLMERGPRLVQEYEQVRDTFGSDQIVGIYARDQDLFSPEIITLLASLQRELARLPQAQRVESLFTVSNIVRTESGIQTGPLLNPQYIPEDPSLLKQKRDQALKNPILREKMLSADGAATLFSLYLEPVPERTRSQAVYYRETYEAVETILSRYRGDLETLYQVGAPAVQVTMSELILEDQKLLLPLAALILALIIGILVRSLLAALIPLLNTLIASIWILAAMVFLDIPVNILNSIIPALLLVIGATEDVHFFAEYRREIKQGKSKEEAIEATGDKIGLTLILTGVTTTLGFLSTAIADLPILQEFGITAGLAMAVRLGLTLVLLPALLRYSTLFRKSVPSTSAEDGKPPQSGPAFWYTRFIMDGVLLHPKWVIFLLAATALSISYFGKEVEVGNDLIEFLDPKTKLVQQVNQVGTELAGTKVLFLTLQGSRDTFKSSAGLQQVARIQDRLNTNENIDSTVSLVDFIALMHREFAGIPHSGELLVPDTPNLISQYLLFLEPETLRPYVNSDFSQANIILRTNLHDSREFSALYQQIQYRLNSGQFGDIDFTLTGQSILIAETVDEIVRGQVLSLAVIIVILFVIVASLFLSWKASLLAVLSNLFPIAILFGLMGLLQIPLNAGTCMVAAITVGIAVDDTLHLMVRYNRELKRSKKESKAIEASLLAEFLPVTATSLALAAGFAVLLFSHFIPLRQFAGLSAMVIFLAVFADLLITPVLLSTTRLITLWDLLGLRLQRALLERSQLFEGMRPWQAKKIILTANLEHYEPGDALVRQGDLGETMYVIIDGDLEVRRGPEHQKTLLAKLGVGDIFGEIALVSRSRRTADVIAASPTRVLALDWNTLLNLQRFAPFLSSRLFLNLSRIMGERMINSLGKLDTAAPFLVDMERKATNPPPS